MPHVTSKDGTRIACTIDGSGPLVILTIGSLDDGSENSPLAANLSRWFRVINYARRVAVTAVMGRNTRLQTGEKQ
jgi:hypothetical protein